MKTIGGGEGGGVVGVFFYFTLGVFQGFAFLINILNY